MLRRLDHFEFVILDDISCVNQSADEAEVLFTQRATYPPPTPQPPPPDRSETPPAPDQKPDNKATATPPGSPNVVVRAQAPFFCSYAQADGALVMKLLARLLPHLLASRRYEFQKWQDTDVLVGEGWNEAILGALERHKIALLMVSPTFLVRPYIREEELPRLLAPENQKVLLPVLLKPIDLRRQDAGGLEALQIFAVRVGVSRRAFSECSSAKEQDRFAMELYRAIEDRLDRDLTR